MPKLHETLFKAAFAIADSWKILQDDFPKMARVTWMHWLRAFHAALICPVVIRTDGHKFEYRARALTCWKSCLRIFERIKDQNQSVISCWRALNRLDTVVKKEMEADRRPRRPSTHKQPRDSSFKFLTTSSNEVNPFSPTIQDFDESSSNASSFGVSPVTNNVEFLWSNGTNIPSSTWPSNPTPIPTILNDHAQLPITTGSSNGTAYLPVSMANLDPALIGGLSSGGFDDYSFSNLGSQYTDVFDMDIQNWPMWLTDQHSPVFG